MEESFSYRRTAVPQDDKVAHLLAEKAYTLLEDLEEYLKDLRRNNAIDVNELMRQKTADIGAQFVAYLNALIEKERGDHLDLAASRTIFSKYVADTKKNRDSEAQVLLDSMKNAVKLAKDAQEASLKAEMKKIGRLVDEEAARIRRDAEEKFENFKKRLLIKVEKQKIKDVQVVQKLETAEEEKKREIDQEKVWVDRLFQSMSASVNAATAIADF